MFRSIPETTRFRRSSYRLITFVIVIFALVESIILVFSLGRDASSSDGSPKVAGLRGGELVYALWKSRSDLIVETLLLFMVSVIGGTAQQIVASVREGRTNR